MNTTAGTIMVRAAAITPGSPGTLAVAEKSIDRPAGWAVIDGIACGLCGTDRGLAEGAFGTSPVGSAALIIGHESYGIVLDPGSTGIAIGTHVVGVVRYPDPVPCAFCRDGRSDLCTNGLFLERGIKGAHGFCASQWVAPKEGLVEVPESLELAAVLVEPTSIVVNACVSALEVSRQRLGRPIQSAVVIGGGTIGVLSMLYLAAQAIDVTLVGTDTATGPAGRLAELCGSRYRLAEEPWPDVELVIECSGSEDVAERLLTDPKLPRFAWIVGIAEQQRPITIDASELLRRIVLANRTIAGVVSCKRHDYVVAASFLASVPRPWLDAIITRNVSLEKVADGLIPRPGDVKVVVKLS
jgi:threonine dehydrogenase-like Zn-dependent dehydrogenase